MKLLASSHALCEIFAYDLSMIPQIFSNPTGKSWFLELMISKALFFFHIFLTLP